MRRFIPILLCVGLLLAGAPAARAGTRTQINVAQRRLVWLEGLVRAKQARISRMHSALKDLAAHVAAGQGDLAEVDGRLETIRAQIVRIHETLAELRAEVARAATQAYIEGPAGFAGALLGTSSLNDAGDLVAYTSSIVSRDRDMAARAKVVELQLRSRRRQQSTLRSVRADRLAVLTSAQDLLAERFGDEMVQLSSLAQLRSQVSSLLVTLHKKLAAEELAAAEAAANGGTPISFGRWAQALLSTLHDPVEHNNLVALVAWQTAEYTDARWNPLATTMPMPGASHFNGSGVRNYVSLAQGLAATEKTLRQTGLGYGAILSALARNARPMDTARAINASQWCRGCSNGEYVVALVPAVARYYEKYAGART